MTTGARNLRVVAYAFAVELAMMLSVVSGLAQEIRTSRAISTDAAIRVDGSLDEPAWTQALVSSGFLQKDPREGEPATEETEIRILYTKTSLFLGIRCSDSDPSHVLATELRRD